MKIAYKIRKDMLTIFDSHFSFKITRIKNDAKKKKKIMGVIKFNDMLASIDDMPKTNAKFTTLLPITFPTAIP